MLAASTLHDQDLHSVLDGISDGLIVYNRDGKVTKWNRAAEEIMQLMGSQFQIADPAQLTKDVIDQDYQTLSLENYPPQVCLRTGIAQNNIIVGLKRTSRDVRWLKISAKPIFVEGYDRPDKVTSIFQDVTFEMNGRRQLTSARKNLEIAAELNGFYCWQFDYSTHSFWTNKEAQKILGNPTDYRTVIERFWQMIHPADLSAIQTAVFAHGNSAEPLRLSHRMNRGDGITI